MTEMSETILLVEDNPSDIALTQRALQRAGITSRLVIVEDGQEALDYLFGTGMHVGRDISQLPALVLLDLKMPKVDGLEVLRRLRANKRTRRVPVIVLTSSKEEQDVAAAYDLGANSYIRKQVDFSQFDAAVKLLHAYWLGLNEPPPKVRLQ